MAGEARDPNGPGADGGGDARETVPAPEPWRPSALQRVAAVLAMLCALAVVVLAITAPIRSFPLGLLAVPLMLLAIAAVWYGLRRRGLRRGLGLGVALLAVAGVLAVLLATDGVGELIAAAVLIAIGVAARQVAFGVGPRALRPPAPETRPAPPAQRGVLIMNPWSGGGKVERFGLAEEARSRGIEPIVLTRGDDLATLAEDAVARGADMLGMAGGDGSQAIVAGVAAKHDLPHVCIPAGTRNHLALDLGVDRDDVVGALDAYADGVERRVDLAEVNGRVFVNNVSLGVYATIVSRGSYRNAKLRTALDLLPDLLGPEAPRFDLAYAAPDGTREEGAPLVMVSNGPYELGPLTGAGTRVRIDLGRLGIAVAEPLGDQRRGTPPVGRRRRVNEWTAPEFVVESSGPVPAGVDGESLTFEPPLRFACRPGALRVRIARRHPGLSPAATYARAGGQTAGALGRIALGRPAARPA